MEHVLSHLTQWSQDTSDSGGNNVIVLAHLLHIGYVQIQTQPNGHTHTHVETHDSSRSKYKGVNSTQSHNRAASTRDNIILVVSKGTLQLPNTITQQLCVFVCKRRRGRACCIFNPNLHLNKFPNPALWSNTYYLLDRWLRLNLC